MDFIVKTTPEELIRARQWWQGLEMQWKFAYNEAVFGKGPTVEPPGDDEMMVLLIHADTLRFAGPFAVQSNVTTTLSNLSGLIPLYHLKFLSLTDMNIKNITELTRFNKMEHLFLYNNKIESINGIENMANLKDLYLQGNEISNLFPLKGLTNIETLYLSNNKITSLKGIKSKHAKKLKKLYILPNEGLSDKDVIKFQNKVGIICRKG